jgi:hypothetical protein
VKAGAPDHVRNKIAATVVSDQEANRLLENISVQISDRIRRESALFQRHQAESRQNQLGRVWDRE